MYSLKSMLLLVVLLLGSEIVFAQQGKPASPRGQAATQLGGQYEGRSYTGGKWIEIDYGRPILRGRTNIFGTGDEYGQALYAGAPVWRAGANQSTTITTKANLMIGGKTLAAGTYTMFIELKSGAWTLILSNHKAKPDYRGDAEGLWGAYEYTDDKDVLRAPMSMEYIDISVDQFTMGFFNVTNAGGVLAMWWENTMASVNFTIAP